MYLVFNPINVTTPFARCRNKIKIYNQFSTINVMFYMRKCKLRSTLRTKFLSLFLRSFACTASNQQLSTLRCYAMFKYMPVMKPNGPKIGMVEHVPQ